MANSHGFEEWDHLTIERWTDVYGNEYEGTEGIHSDDDFAEADWMQVGIHYPDGSVEYRNFVGPWNDEEHFYDDIQEWWDSDGTP